MDMAWQMFGLFAGGLVIGAGVDIGMWLTVTLLDRWLR
jgi:hypothetical protein